MTKEHELKCWPQFFQATQAGTKTFEVRKNDRGFSVGDVLVLREWEPHDHGMGADDDEPAGHYTSAVPLRRVITFVLPGGRFGIDPDCVVMGIDEQDSVPEGFTVVKGAREERELIVAAMYRQAAAYRKSGFEDRAATLEWHAGSIANCDHRRIKVSAAEKPPVHP